MRRAGLILGVLLLGCDGEAAEEGLERMGFSAPNTIEAAPGALFRGTFSPDGSEFYYFAKVTEGEEDYRVFQTVLSTSGWSEPRMLALGDSTASSMYPVVSPDGELLVFTSYRPVHGETANADLWAARWRSGRWSDPFPLVRTSTAENYDASPWFGPHGALRFTSTSPDWSETWMRAALRTGDSFGAWTEDEFWDDLEWPRATHHFWSGILNRTGTVAVIELSARNADGSLGASDLWIATREAGGWSEAMPWEQTSIPLVWRIFRHLLRMTRRLSLSVTSRAFTRWWLEADAVVGGAQGVGLVCPHLASAPLLTYSAAVVVLGRSGPTLVQCYTPQVR